MRTIGRVDRAVGIIDRVDRAVGTIDRAALPGETRTLRLSTVEELVAAVRRLAIRGARRSGETVGRRRPARASALACCRDLEDWRMPASGPGWRDRSTD